MVDVSKPVHVEKKGSRLSKAYSSNCGCKLKPTTPNGNFIPK
jgi:hypothetical protein